MCSSLAYKYLLLCMIIGLNGMAIHESIEPQRLLYFPGGITPVYKCFDEAEIKKSLQCLADTLGRISPRRESDLDLSSDDLRTQRHVNVTETEEMDQKIDGQAEPKKVRSYKAGRRRRHKGNLMIPAVIGLAALITTTIIGVTGLVAGKALALSFLALVVTLALSTRAVSSHQRSTVVKEAIPEALAEITHQLLSQGTLTEDAIVYSSYLNRDG